MSDDEEKLKKLWQEARGVDIRGMIRGMTWHVADMPPIDFSKGLEPISEKASYRVANFWATFFDHPARYSVWGSFDSNRKNPVRVGAIN